MTRPALHIIERLVPGGLGLVRDDGGVIFVRGAFEGEQVSLKNVRKKRGTRFADVDQVVRPSPHRRAPDCPAHPRCGGCDLLALDPAAAREAKRGMVLDALRRTAGIDADDLVGPLVEAPLFARARRRCRLQLDPLGRPGFFARSSSEAVRVDGCPALAAPLDACIAKLSGLKLHGPARLRLACDDRGHVSAAVEDAPPARRARIARALVEGGAVRGALVLDDDGVLSASFGDPVLEGEVAPGHPRGPFRSDAAVFTQATRFGAAQIGAAVLDALDVTDYDGGPLLELFAGAGHLTIPLAERSAALTAVEGAGRSAQTLRENLDRAGIFERARVLIAQLHAPSFPEMFVDQLIDVPTALVIDPPRTGFRGIDEVLDFLKPRSLVLVSCDLATGAREIKAALGAGYALKKLTAIDAFVRTAHVEWVAALVREES